MYPQSKCAKYWPDKVDGVLKTYDVYGGTLSVSFVSSTQHTDYELREFELVRTMTSGSDSAPSSETTDGASVRRIYYLFLVERIVGGGISLSLIDEL